MLRSTTSRLFHRTVAALVATALVACVPANASGELEERALSTMVRLAFESPETAIGELGDLLTEAREAKDRRTEGALLWGLAAAWIHQGDPARALELARESLATWEEIGEPVWIRRARLQETVALARLANPPDYGPQAARVAFLRELVLLESKAGRLGDALRLTDHAISLLEEAENDPFAERVWAAMVIGREGTRRLLGLPRAPDATLERVRALIPEQSEWFELLSQILDLDELGERGSLDIDKAERIRAAVEAIPDVDPALIAMAELLERAKTEGLGAYLDYCERASKDPAPRPGEAGATSHPVPFCDLLNGFASSLEAKRLDPGDVRVALDRMMELVRTGHSASQMTAGRSLLMLEGALEPPTAPEDWPTTEELAKTLEAAEWRTVHVPPELRSAADAALSIFNQVAVRIRARVGDAAGAFELAERARARVFLDRLTAKRSDRPDPEILEEIATLRRRRADLGREIGELSVTDPASPGMAERVDELFAVDSELETAFQRLALTAPAAERATPASWADVVAGLDSETTLVAFMDFAEQPGRPLAWVINRERGLLVRYLLSPGRLEGQIEHLAASLRNHGDPTELAEEIYRNLWAPLRDHVDTPRVLLVPHGVYQELPFAVLRDPDTGRWLIQDHALLYAPSASAWVHLASQPSRPVATALVLGDPEENLPGSASAARAIADLWGSTALVGSEADERALRARAPRSGLIHLSGHGWRVTDPAFTYLGLAPSAGSSTDSRNDGRLELHEIAEELDLANTELAVLPACHTGDGPRTRGDEVTSLARAFLLAGARSVVTTGWRVDDGKSASLMRDFHRQLAAGVESAEALQHAQMAAIESRGRSDPSLWAAFALHGAGGRLAPAREPSRSAPAVLSDRALEALESFAQEGWVDTTALEKALQATQPATDPLSEVALLWGLSHAAIEEGRFQDSLRLARRGRAASEALGEVAWTQRLVTWGGLAAALDGGEPAAPPVLRALFLAELMHIEMDRLRIGEMLRQADLALGLIDGLGQDDLALRLRLFQAAASGTGSTSEATLARLSAVMEEGAQAIAADRIEGRPDVTPLINALPELMLSMSSANVSAGLKVLEGLAEEHGDLLPPELIGLLEMAGHLDDQNTEAAADWCQRAEGAAHLVPDPSGSGPSSLAGLICSLTDFLAANEETEAGAVDLTALGDLFQVAGALVESQEGPFREPLQGLHEYALDLLRATQIGDEIPPMDDLLVALQDLDAIQSALPPTRRAGFDEVFVAPFGHLSTWLSVRAGNAEDSFRFAESVRAREFLDLLDLRLHTGWNGEAGAITKLRRRAEALEERLFERSTRDPQDPEVGALRAEIETLRIEIDDRFGRLALNLGETARTPPAPLAAIQAALGDDTTLVTYLIPSFNEDESLSEDPLAWVVDRDAIELIQLDVDAETLASDVRLFVEQLRSYKDSDEVAERLYSALWRPLRSHVGTRRVLVVPHGVLLGLPFAALRDPDSGTELVQEATLLYAPSASAWTRLRDRASGNGNRVVMGNPTRNLAAAESEARTLADLWGTAALTGGAASERRFRELAPGASLVHVASHGVLAPVDPAFTYLRLASSPDAEADPRADGRLELHEILGDLDLSGTGLVVLSSCRAGAGPTTRGGEMTNLARALLLAGARSTVTAAWDVDDRAAEILMVDFHRRLAAGTEAAEALRGAQEAALSGGKYRHPGFWAGFALHGAGGRVTSPDRR